jgi:hypothetical protein
VAIDLVWGLGLGDPQSRQIEQIEQAANISELIRLLRSYGVPSEVIYQTPELREAATTDVSPPEVSWQNLRTTLSSLPAKMRDVASEFRGLVAIQMEGAGVVAEDGKFYRLAPMELGGARKIEVVPAGIDRNGIISGWEEVEGGDSTVIDQDELESLIPPPLPVDLPYIEPYAGALPDDHRVRRQSQERRDRVAALGLDIDDPYEAGFINVPGLPMQRPGELWYGPNYVVGDEVRLFAGKDPAYVAEVEDLLIQGGYLDASDRAFPGTMPGAAFYRAVNILMGDANLNAIHWEDQLKDRVDALSSLSLEERAIRMGRQPFVTPTYVAPDYNELTATVRAALGASLGRRPKDWELALLADRLRADHRSSYEVDVAAARAEYNAGNRALVLGETDQGGGTVTDVNPAARLGEAIERMYAPEIERNELAADTQANVSQLLRSLSGLESYVGS